nr:MAG: hypothetical protein [Wenzhou shrew henipavirus 1]
MCKITDSNLVERYMWIIKNLGVKIMPWSIYETPYSESGSSRRSDRRTSRGLDYKCIAILLLFFILTVTIVLSFSTSWFGLNIRETGYPTYIDSRGVSPQERIEPTDRLRTRKPGRYPFRPGLPGRGNCETRTVQAYP